MRFSINKKLISRVVCSIAACVMLVSALSFNVFAYGNGLFDYDKYADDTDRYKIKESLENRYISYDWNNDNITEDTKEAILKYQVQDISTGKSYDPMVLKQKVRIRFRLPDEYTSFYTKNRQFRIYSYEKGSEADPPKVKDETEDESFNYGFAYSFYYRDLRLDYGTKATVIGTEICQPSFITIYSEKDDKTPSFEEAVEEKLLELEQEKAKKEESDKKASYYNYVNKVTRDNYGDRVVLTLFRRVETPEYGTKTPMGRYNAPHEFIEHWHYWEEWEIYEIKRIKEIPNLYLVNLVRQRIQENYEIGENNPVKEAVELHNLVNERYEHTNNVIIPVLTNVQYEILPEEIESFEKEEGVHIVVDTDASDGTGGNETVESGNDNANVEKSKKSTKKENKKGNRKEKVGGGFNETSTNIPAAVFVAVAGGAAAAGAAGASSEKKKGRRKSTFKLAINKNFGNTIGRQRAPVYVYARIIEVTPEGHEITRADLSANIQIYAGSQGINVEDAGMTEGYRAARVFAPNSQETECIISFRFNYEGNSFTENVRFHLAGDPYIEFPDKDRLATTHVVNGLFGDGETYEVPFIIKDFFEQLDTSEIKIYASENDMVLSCIKDAEKGGQFFKAVVLNRSEKHDTKRRCSIMIEAKKGTESATGSFYFELYPEGLSIDGKKVDGRLQIKSYRDAKQFDESVLIEQTNFYPTLAVAEKGAVRRTVNVVDFRKYPLEIGPIQADATYMEKFIEKYNYHIDDRALYTNTQSVLSFYPESNIPEGKQPYYVKISFRCSYEGTDYILDQSIRLLGEPLKPMSKKETEIMYLESFIIKYMVDEERDAMLERVRAKYEVFSDSEIKAMRQDLWVKMRDRMLADGAKQKLWGDILDWTYCGLDWCKWIGDICFSILVSTYAGPLADAIISPAKDIVTASLGETADHFISGRPFDYKNLQVFSNVETVAENIITKDMKLTNLSGIKQAGWLLASFYVLNVFKNYVTRIEQDGVCDLYGAIIDGFSNMTSLFAKALAGDMFKKFLQSQSFKSALGTKLGKWIQEQIKFKYTALIDTARAKNGSYKFDGLEIKDFQGDIDWMTDWNFYKFTKSDLFGKCMEEIAGGDSIAKGILAVQYEGPTPEDLAKSGVHYYQLYKKEFEVEQDVWLKIDFLPLFNNAKDTMSKLYDTIFDFFFVMITFDSKPRELPKDPPLQDSV